MTYRICLIYLILKSDSEKFPTCGVSTLRVVSLKYSSSIWGEQWPCTMGSHGYADYKLCTKEGPLLLWYPCPHVILSLIT